MIESLDKQPELEAIKFFGGPWDGTTREVDKHLLTVTAKIDDPKLIPEAFRHMYRPKSKFAMIYARIPGTYCFIPTDMFFCKEQ